jgi:hypothetical protein
VRRHYSVDVMAAKAEEVLKGVRLGSDQGQTGVRPGSDQGQTPLPSDS